MLVKYQARLNKMNMVVALNTLQTVTLKNVHFTAHVQSVCISTVFTEAALHWNEFQLSIQTRLNEPCPIPATIPSISHTLGVWVDPHPPL